MKYSDSLDENIKWLKNECDCFDLTFRSVTIKEDLYILVFVGGIVTSDSVGKVVVSLAMNKENLTMFPSSVVATTSLEDGLANVLAGNTLVMKQGSCFAFCVDTKIIPDRNPSEPTVEKSIRGARDGFVETLTVNLGLIRKRIKDPNLVIKNRVYGDKTCTNIAVFYINDLVEKKLLDDVNNRLDKISIATNLQSESQLTQLMYKQIYNPYPHVRYTERPDLVCVHLLQGNVAILLDHCPNAILMPITYFSCTSQIEEFNQSPSVAFFLSLLRFSGLIASVFLVPVSIALIEFKSYPLQLAFVFEVIVADSIIEWIRLSLIHSPTLLSSLLGMIAVFVLGEAAISIGQYTQEVLILVAIANVGNFVTSNYELSMANKLVRIILVLSTLVFQMYGLGIAILIYFIMLYKTDVGPVNFLHPVIPFDWQEFKKIFTHSYIKK